MWSIIRNKITLSYAFEVDFIDVFLKLFQRNNTPENLHKGLKNKNLFTQKEKYRYYRILLS